MKIVMLVMAAVMACGSLCAQVSHEIFGVAFDVYEDGKMVAKKATLSVTSYIDKDGRGFVDADLIWVVPSSAVRDGAQGIILEPHHCTTTEDTIKNVKYSNTSLSFEMFISKLMPDRGLKVELTFKKQGPPGYQIEVLSTATVYGLWKVIMTTNEFTKIELRQVAVTTLPSNKLVTNPLN